MADDWVAAADRALPSRWLAAARHELHSHTFPTTGACIDAFACPQPGQSAENGSAQQTRTLATDAAFAPADLHAAGFARVLRFGVGESSVKVEMEDASASAASSSSSSSSSSEDFFAWYDRVNATAGATAADCHEGAVLLLDVRAALESRALFAARRSHSNGAHMVGSADADHDKTAEARMLALVRRVRMLLRAYPLILLYWPVNSAASESAVNENGDDDDDAMRDRVASAGLHRAIATHLDALPLRACKVPVSTDAVLAHLYQNDRQSYDGDASGQYDGAFGSQQQPPAPAAVNLWPDVSCIALAAHAPLPLRHAPTHAPTAASGRLFASLWTPPVGSASSSLASSSSSSLSLSSSASLSSLSSSASSSSSALSSASYSPPSVAQLAAWRDGRARLDALLATHIHGCPTAHHLLVSTVQRAVEVEGLDDDQIFARLRDVFANSIVRSDEFASRVVQPDMVRFFCGGVLCSCSVCESEDLKWITIRANYVQKRVTCRSW
jgi:hypothetical protein